MANNLKGGVLAWAHHGKNFINEDGNTLKRIHVFEKSWALVPDGYEAIW